LALIGKVITIAYPLGKGGTAAAVAKRTFDWNSQQQLNNNKSEMAAEYKQQIDTDEAQWHS
jgi:hypothetical protein